MPIATILASGKISASKKTKVLCLAVLQVPIYLLIPDRAFLSTWLLRPKSHHFSRRCLSFICKRFGRTSLYIFWYMYWCSFSSFSDKPWRSIILRFRGILTKSLPFIYLLIRGELFGCLVSIKDLWSALSRKPSPRTMTPCPEIDSLETKDSDAEASAPILRFEWIFPVWMAVSICCSPSSIVAVSYTHLTLPTICSV